MSDKMSRLSNLLNKQKAEVKDESITDTIMDLINYAAILSAYIHRNDTDKPAVCVDFDGVLAEYQYDWEGPLHFGNPIPGAIEFTHKLSKNYHVIIWSCRTTKMIGWSQTELVELLKKYLDKYKYYYDDIFISGNKPNAIAFIDDRSISCLPMDNENIFEDILTSLDK